MVVGVALQAEQHPVGDALRGVPAVCHVHRGAGPQLGPLSSSYNLMFFSSTKSWSEGIESSG